MDNTIKKTKESKNQLIWKPTMGKYALSHDKTCYKYFVKHLSPSLPVFKDFISYHTGKMKTQNAVIKNK